jgi:hypothetical protein
MTSPINLLYSKPCPRLTGASASSPTGPSTSPTPPMFPQPSACKHHLMEKIIIQNFYLIMDCFLTFILFRGTFGCKDHFIFTMDTKRCRITSVGDYCLRLVNFLRGKCKKVITRVVGPLPEPGST